MNILRLFLINPAQFGAGWQLDWPSFVLGLAVGVALLLALRWLLPIARRWRDRALGRVRDTYDWLRSGVASRYREETAAFVQRHHLGGRWAPLGAIFVPPRLLAPPPEPVPEAGGQGDIAEFSRLWPDLAAGLAMPPLPTESLRQWLINARRVILSGAPGSGKTTLLAACTLRCIQAAPEGRDAPLARLLPAFIHAVDLEPVAGQEEDVAATLARALQRRAITITAVGLNGLVQRQLAEGKVLLLLDGLDEIPATARTAVVSWLGQLLAAYPATRAIVAAPEEGYGPLLKLGFTLSGIWPWRAGQAAELGQAWAGATKRPASERHTYWRPGQDPLTTTLRLWLAETTDQPPAARLPELMARALELWLPAATGHDWLPAAARELWERLAFQMLDDGLAQLSPALVAGQAGEIVARAGVTSRGATAALQKTVESSQLFIAGPAGAVRFFSPVWRDYLAAVHLARRGETAVAAAHLDDPEWAGVLRFYAALVDPAPLASRLLPADGHLLAQRLFLLASWLPHASAEGEWRRQTMIRLGQLVMMKRAPLALRWRAAAAMAQSGEPGAAAFLRQLASQPELTLRQTAAAAVSCLPPAIAAELLEQMTGSDNERLRATAVHALAWLPDPAAEQPLLLTLLSSDQKLSDTAASALALNGAEGFDVLREALRESSLVVRRAAVHGLALIDADWVDPLLLSVNRQDSEWAVKAAAAAALETRDAARKKPPRQTVAAGDLAWLISWAAGHGRGVPAGDAAQPLLYELLEGGETAALRAAAARSLAYLGDVTAVAVLQAALRDPEQEVRDAAFVALATLHRAFHVLAPASTPAPLN